MGWLQATIATFVATLGALLYSRADVLALMYTNAPNRLERVNAFNSFNIQYVDYVRNCEDAVLDADAGFALLSCDPGRDSWNTVMGPVDVPKSPPDTGIYLWNYTVATSKPDKLKLLDFDQHLSDFHPLGIEYQPSTQTLTVINLAEAEARVSIFKLSAVEMAATHLGSFQHASLSAPNSVVAISESEYLITNNHFFSRRKSAILPLLETYLGVPGGSIVYVDMKPTLIKDAPVIETIGRLGFANGIALFNDSTVAVASSSMASVTLYSIGKERYRGPPKLMHYQTIKVPLHPDNLSVDGNGKLLIAGHPHAPSMEKLAKNSARCNSVGNESKKGCDRIKAPSMISEWSERDRFKTLYAGIDYDSSSTALRDVDRQIGMAVGLYAKGMMVWDASVVWTHVEY